MRVTAADRAITGAKSLVNRDTPGAKVFGFPARIRAPQPHPSENVSYDLKEVETPEVAQPVFTINTDRKSLREKPSR
jgi:serine acetyltransferase